ncbi:MAG: hypothetical protein DRP09_16875 [Candidatus Thorarchaeota archaeon]|nr:MAG: hypothetical protein DRP09_16875 [Candidatus Thorarchaeota archaeon]
MVGRSGVEYADYTVSVYSPPCPYGCIYCFNRLPKFRHIKLKSSRIQAALRVAMQPKGVVVVSFLSDPYPPEEYHKGLTRQVLQILGKSHHTVLVLTKNPTVALVRDGDLFKKYDMWLGSTITSLQPLPEYEPNAPPNPERIRRLREAHRMGIKVWISLEPLLRPRQLIRMLKRLSFADFIVIGSLNHSRQLKLHLDLEQDYLYYVPRAIVYLESELLFEPGSPPQTNTYLIKQEMWRILSKHIPTVTYR